MTRAFIKLNRTMLKELNQNEAYLYALLSACVDLETGKVVGKTRSYFTQMMFGCVTKNNVDTITKYIDHMVRLGLVTKKQGYNDACTYKVTPLKENYIEIYRDLIFSYKEVPVKAKGMLIQLATIAFKDTNRIDYDVKTAAPKIGVAINTYKKYWKILESYGLISNRTLNTACVRKYSSMSEAYRKVEKFEEELCSFDITSRYYKQMLWVKQTIDENSYNEIQVLNYKHLMYRKILAGILNDAPKYNSLEEKFKLLL